MRTNSVLVQASNGLATAHEPFQNKGIVILIHGLNASASSFRAETIFRVLELQLAALGWAVYVPSITGDGSSQASTLQTSFNSNDSGSVELASVLSQWETWVTSARAAASGTGLPVVAGGISWGGLYAIQIAGRATTLPDGLFVHVPASDPNFLTEFTSYGLSSLGDVRGPGLESSAGVPRVPTLLSYATDDTRVGYTTTATLATDIGADTQIYSSLGHTTNNAVVNALTGWVDAQTF